MAILNRFSHSSMVGKPFADYLNISVPLDSSDELRDSLLGVLDGLQNFQEVTPGLFKFFVIELENGKVVLRPFGSVKFGRRGKVATVSTSGGVLRLLRDHSLFDSYLAAIGSFPHRVTMLHATADFLCSDVPSAINAVKDAAYAGELALTRKKILPKHCKHVFNLDVDGKETGTVYLGQKDNADVWAKVYDKRNERLSRGFAEPGSLARVEVACMSDVGVTLRDVADPTDIFYHHAGRTLVDVPPDFQGWEAHGEGYVLGERPERSLFERFEWLISGSLDIRRAAEMALALYGRDVAAQALGRKVLALVTSPM